MSNRKEVVALSQDLYLECDKVDALFCIRAVDQSYGSELGNHTKHDVQLTSIPCEGFTPDQVIAVEHHMSCIIHIFKEALGHEQE